jgi:tryptophan-rich sensory protein
MRKIPPRRADWISLVVFVAACLLIGVAGGIATGSSVTTWYVGLSKPSWNPPDWVFGPVWTVLYVMMGVSVWLVWRRRHEAETRVGMVLFGLQLILNAAWSAIFFGMQQPGWAAAEVVALWLSIMATIVAFARISKPAAWLLVPYLAWVSFASVLNFTIWRMNL